MASSTKELNYISLSDYDDNGIEAEVNGLKLQLQYATGDEDILQRFKQMQLTDDDISQCTLICHQGQKIGRSTHVSNTDMHPKSAIHMRAPLIFPSGNHLERNLHNLENEITKDQQLNHILYELYEVDTIPNYTISLLHQESLEKEHLSVSSISCDPLPNNEENDFIAACDTALMPSVSDMADFYAMVTDIESEYSNEVIPMLDEDDVSVLTEINDFNEVDVNQCNHVSD